MSEGTAKALEPPIGRVSTAAICHRDFLMTGAAESFCAQIASGGCS